MKSFKPILFIAAIALSVSSCKKDSDDDVTTPVAADYKTNLTEISNDVITQTYLDLANKVNVMVAAMNTLQANQTIQNLDAARQAWRDSRRPWEQSEGFLFGPVDVQGIDPAIDSWPVNQVDLQAVLNSSDALTQAYVDALDGTLKGFHTVEYLLWGGNGNKQFSDFTSREFEYLLACSQSMKGSTDQLYDNWNTSSINYGANLINAGTSTSIYVSQKSALQELVNGLIGIADEVANGKINDPYSQQDVTLEESRFSANSKADFADNITSIRNVYLGTLSGSSSNGISAIIAAKNSALDTRVKQEIEDAILAIQNIPGTFTTAIFNNPTEVENARNKVNTLMITLQGDVMNVINNL